MAIYPTHTLLMDMKFRPGDMFVVEGKAAISGLIRYFSRGLASHAGLITDSFGNTIESLHRIRHAHVADYLGQRIVIVRPIAFEEKKEEAIKAVRANWLNKRYPYWRLLVHAIDSILPTFGKINLLKIPVCSELVAFAGWKMGVRDGDKIWGTNPDDLADEWLFSDKYEIVYRGRLTK